MTYTSVYKLLDHEEDEEAWLLAKNQKVAATKMLVRALKA